MIPLFALLLLGEGVLLYFGQRRLFGAIESATHSRFIAYFLAAPGTVLHESAHYIMALVLGVPAGDRVRTKDGKRGRVSFFFPHREEDGSTTLGSVPVAAADPLRSSLISIAPIILVPPLFAVLTLILLPVSSPSDLGTAFVAAPFYSEALWVYLGISCSQAAFPSTGDHVGVLGAFALVLLAGLLVSLLASAGELLPVLNAVVILLALPAAAAGISLAALGALSTRTHR